MSSQTQAIQLVSDNMSDNNYSLARQANSSNDSDRTVDSEDEAIADGNSVPSIVASSALNHLTSAMTTNSIQMQNCENVTFGNKNYFHGPVTIIYDAKSDASLQPCNQSKSDSRASQPVDYEFKFISRGKWLARPPKNHPQNYNCRQPKSSYNTLRQTML